MDEHRPLFFVLDRHASGKASSLAREVTDRSEIAQLLKQVGIGAARRNVRSLIYELTVTKIDGRSPNHAMSLTAYGADGEIKWTFGKSTLGLGLLTVFGRADAPRHGPDTVHQRCEHVPNIVLADNGFSSLALMVARVAKLGQSADIKAYLPSISISTSLSIERSGDMATLSIGMRLFYGSDGQVTAIQLGSADAIARNEAVPAGFEIEACRCLLATETDLPKDVRESEVYLQWKGRQLTGTLTLPETPVRYVFLFLAGSGIHDRHGQWMGLSLPYSTWCREFSRRCSAAVLRVDRLDFARGDAQAQFAAITYQDLVSQAEAWRECLRGDQRFAGAEYGVVGHSLGGVVALDIAQRNDFRGWLCLLAAPGRNLSEVLWDQARETARQSPTHEGELLAKHRVFQDVIRGLKPLDAIEGEIDRSYIQARKKMFASMFDLDPSELARKTRAERVLMLRGKDDAQVFEVDFARLRHSFQSGLALVAKQFPSRDHLFEPTAAQDSTPLAERQQESAALLGLQLYKFLEEKTSLPARALRLLTRLGASRFGRGLR